MGARTKSGLPGVYNSSALVLADGDGVALAVNSSGIMQAYEAYLAAGEDLVANVQVVENRYSYTGITSTATTTVKSGAGFLHALIINTPVASSVITLYDNTAGSGTKIGTITLPAVLVSQGPDSAIYNVSFTTGLTIVTATGASDITVAWR